MNIRAEQVRFSYGTMPVLNGIDVELDQRCRVTALIGPNAAGKSTFLRCLAGLLRPRGSVQLDGRPLASISPADRASLVTYLPQDLPNSAALTVFEAVLVARRQVRAGWRVGPEDVEAVASVLERLGIAALAARHLNELSGGQRQMVAVGQALAVSPRVLLLDEPTSSLDLHHQLELLTLVTELAAERRMTVVLAVHDLNLAARFSDQILVMAHGRIVARGRARDVITPELLRDVYRVDAQVLIDADDVPLVVPKVALREPAHREKEYAAHD